MTDSMPGIALVFPGQGSQRVGMIADVLERFAAARQVMEKASSLLGYSVTDLCLDGPAETLQQTEFAQPAIFAASIAVLEALRESLEGRLAPLVVAGHSLGEYSAIVASGAMSFETGLRLVQERGRLMQQAGVASPGAMSALIGLGDDEARRICQEVSERGTVIVANYNSPGQIVISGAVSAVEMAESIAKMSGAKRAVRLPVSGAFHSPLMQPAADRYSESLSRAEIGDSGIPVIGNVSASMLATSDELRAELSDQLVSPVRWTESVATMRRLGARRFVEVGPGSVLTGLIRRTLKDVYTHAVGDAAGLEGLRGELTAGLVS